MPHPNNDIAFYHFGPSTQNCSQLHASLADDVATVVGWYTDHLLNKMELIEAVIALRQQVEGQLRKNEYYVALMKLDEVMAVIKPAESIEDEYSRESDFTVDSFSMARLFADKRKRKAEAVFPPCARGSRPR